MTSQIILHRPKSEKIIRYSLNNSISITEELQKKLIEKGYQFIRNYEIGNYSFDFYCPQLKIAIEIDGYAHEFSDVYNNDGPKKLYVQSLGIVVLKFTDYQILVDIEDVFRRVKHQAKLSKNKTFTI
ncbi:hypothetical protein AB832_03940 [Flavobacteriaceae bacterium (ex Bugula neritina AB1)]|nr:hypothetical protein AB832_03940 [Flavobacteriaceae bacterium (ex Bugula neritina AB1)]